MLSSFLFHLCAESNRKLYLFSFFFISKVCLVSPEVAYPISAGRVAFLRTCCTRNLLTITVCTFYSPLRSPEMMKTTLVVLSLVAGAAGHGSMIMPPSRNSVDASPGMPWAGGKHPATGLIEPYTCRCSNGTDICNNGQSCFWFTQGASVGCTTADGNGTRLPNLDHCPTE